MGFIERELERVTEALQAGPLPADRYGQLFAVQQALSWALEPNGFKSPYLTIEEGRIFVSNAVVRVLGA